MTMKKFRSLIALLLALLALPMCLFACEEGSKGNDEGTIDPMDTTDGLRVDINIRELSKEEGEPGIYFIKTGADFRIQPGTTLEQAVAALCEERGATYEMDIIGKFSKFTFDGATIVAEMQEQKDGTFVEISFKVTINGTEVKDYKDIALNHNDLVEIELVKGEAFTAS